MTAIAVIGAGRWGRHLARNFAQLPGATLVAVVDADGQRLAQLPLPDGVMRLEEWRRALALPGLQAVAIATPATTHYELVRAALGQGLHVLAEKPLTLSAATCEELCQLAAARNLQLVVDHTYLFHPAVVRGRDAIATLGPLRYGYASRTHLGPVRQDVDALWDLAVHDIAIFNHWLAQRPVQVQATGTAWLQPQPRPGSPHGLVDTGWIQLRYGDGFCATLHLSWLNPDKQRRLAVVGAHGTLVFDELAPQPLRRYGGRFGPDFAPTDVATDPLDYPPAEPLAQVCQHFLDCVQRGQPSTVSDGRVGQDLVRIQQGVAQALASGAPVSLAYG